MWNVFGLLLLRQQTGPCLQVLQDDLELLSCGQKDFDWAVSVLHSRCFIEGPASTHMTVPGVDMANHSFTPSASVRYLVRIDTGLGYRHCSDLNEPPASHTVDT